MHQSGENRYEVPDAELSFIRQEHVIVDAQLSRRIVTLQVLLRRPAPDVWALLAGPQSVTLVVSVFGVRVDVPCRAVRGTWRSDEWCTLDFEG